MKFHREIKGTVLYYIIFCDEKRNNFFRKKNKSDQGVIDKIRVVDTDFQP